MIPLFSAAQVRAADNYAIKKLGIPGIVLMENASLSIFHSILVPESHDNFLNLNTAWYKPNMVDLWGAVWLQAVQLQTMNVQLSPK